MFVKHTEKKMSENDEDFFIDDDQLVASLLSDISVVPGADGQLTRRLVKNSARRSYDKEDYTVSGKLIDDNNDKKKSTDDYYFCAYLLLSVFALVALIWLFVVIFKSSLSYSQKAHRDPLSIQDTKWSRRYDVEIVVTHCDSDELNAQGTLRHAVRLANAFANETGGQPRVLVTFNCHKVFVERDLPEIEVPMRFDGFSQGVEICALSNISHIFHVGSLVGTKGVSLRNMVLKAANLADRAVLLDNARFNAEHVRFENVISDAVFSAQNNFTLSISDSEFLNAQTGVTVQQAQNVYLARNTFTIIGGAYCVCIDNCAGECVEKENSCAKTIKIL